MKNPVQCGLVMVLAAAVNHGAQDRPSVRMADLDGDGLLDRLQHGQDGSLSIALNQGARRFVEVLQSLPAVLVTDVLVNDLDGDGRVDLYLVSPRDNVALVGDGCGRFTDRTADLGLADHGVGLRAEAVDIDADGTRDILLHNSNGDVIFWGLADGRFGRAAWSTAPEEPESMGALLPGPDATLPAPAGAHSPQASGSGPVRAASGRGAQEIGPDDHTARAAFDGGASPSVAPAMAIPSCATTVKDATTGDCLAADSSPTLGRLYPLGPDFNIDPSGNVGIGTLSPGNKLTVVGTIESLSGGIQYPDGTVQTTASRVVYTRWGRTTCPAGSELVYEGVVGAGHYTFTGGGASTLCLSKTPTWDDFNGGNQNGNLMYGLEYQTGGSGIASLAALHSFEAPCAVCLRSERSAVIMVPGTQVCPASWNLEYAGYLMSSHYTQNRSETVCVDRMAEAIGSATSVFGGLWYPTEAELGSLTAPYVQDRELTCSVCSR